MITGFLNYQRYQNHSKPPYLPFFRKCSPILTELGILQVCSIRTSDLRISVCLATVGAAGSWDASHHHCLVAMTDVMPSGLRGRRNTGELGKFTRADNLKNPAVIVNISSDIHCLGVSSVIRNLFKRKRQADPFLQRSMKPFKVYTKRL